MGDKYSDNLLPVNDMEFGLKILSSGIGNGALFAGLNARGLIFNLGIDNLNIYDAGLTSQEFAFASENKELIRKIDNEIINLKSTGQYDKIYYKWFGKKKQTENLVYLYWLIGIIFIITLSSVIVSYILKIKVNKAVSEISFLNKSLNMMNRKANIEIFMYDVEKGKISILRNGKYHATDIDINNINDNVHPEDKEKYLADYFSRKKIINDEVILNLRLFEPYKNKYCFYEIVLLPIFSRKEGGRPKKYLFTKRDETEQKELIESQEELITRFNIALNSGKLLRWEYDIEEQISKVIDVNNKEYSFTGHEGIDRIHSEDRETFIMFMTQLKSGNKDVASIEVKIKEMGEENFKPYEITAKIRFDEDRKPIALYGIWRDISEIDNYKAQLKEKIVQLKKANAELAVRNKDIAESEERLKVILKKLPVPIYMKDPETRKHIYLNDAAVSVFDATVDTRSKDFINAEEAIKQEEVDDYVVMTGEEYTANEKITLRNGVLMDTYVKKILIDHKGKKQILVVRMDLTEQRLAQIAKKILTTSIAALNAYSWYFDTRSNRIHYSDKYIDDKRILVDLNTFEKFIEILHPDDVENYNDFVHKLKSYDSGVEIMSFRVDMVGDGNYQWWESRAMIETITGENETYKLIYGIDINIDDQKQNEMKLRKSAELLTSLNRQNELILNNMSSALVYIDPDFNIQWSNTHQVFKDKRTNPYKVGCKCYSYFKRNEPCDNCPVAKALKQRAVVKEELVTSDNRAWDVVAMPVFSEDGSNIEGVVYKLDNITMRKKLIEDLKQAKHKSDKLNLELSSINELMFAILNQIPSCLFVKDIRNDFKYILANNSFCKYVVGKTRKEIIGYTDYEIFREKGYAEKFRTDDINTRRQSINEVYNCGEEKINLNGEERIFQVRKLAVRLSNNKEYVIGQATDITEIKEINSNLIIAKEKAEVSERLKMAFLANMSHEIRTPLNAIVGFSELIKFAETETEKEEYMKLIDDNNELLLRLISDILDISKIESGSIEIKPVTFDIVEAFNDVYMTHKSRFKNNNVEFEKICNAKKYLVTLDRNRVFQVLANYIMNAIKYTTEGKITIGMETDKSGVKIWVKDTGIGISKENQHLVFHRFEKFDEFAQGTGLGLAISKAITETMNGNVGFTSEKNVGSTFWAWFPNTSKEDISDNKENEVERIKTMFL